MLSALALLASAPLLATGNEPADDGGIWDRLEVYANGRVRAEGTFDQVSGKDRIRGRLRFRLGAKYQIADDLKAEARLSTLSDGSDPNNPHWDFGDGDSGFDPAQVGLDRFYLDWLPDPTLHVKTGKQPHAFAAPPVYSEFVWDGDVQPAGVVGTWAPKASEGAARYDARLAGYIAVENGNDNDPHMLGGQVNGWFPVSDEVEVHAAASFSDWSNINAGSGIAGNQGNTASNGGFATLEGFVDATWKGGPLGRTQGFVQVMNNVDDDSKEDSGFAFGAKVGKSGKPGDTNVFASYFDFDANAFFSPVAQDDTPISGTGAGLGLSGVIVGVERTWTENVSFKLWALTADADLTEDPYRIRFEVNFSVR